MPVSQSHAAVEAMLAGDAGATLLACSAASA